MRRVSLIAIPLLWFISVSIHAEVFKCITDGKVEYRDVACAGNAEQQIITLADAPVCDDTAGQAVATARLRYLREADAALSARLAREHELRLQFAAEEALAAQQAQIARAEAERQAESFAVPVYWPARYSHRAWRRGPAGRGWMPQVAGRFSRQDFVGRPAGMAGIRSVSMPFTPMQNIIPR